MNLALREGAASTIVNPVPRWNGRGKSCACTNLCTSPGCSSPGHSQGSHQVPGPVPTSPIPSRERDSVWVLWDCWRGVIRG